MQANSFLQNVFRVDIFFFFNISFHFTIMHFLKNYFCQDLTIQTPNRMHLTKTKQSSSGFEYCKYTFKGGEGVDTCRVRHFQTEFSLGHQNVWIDREGRDRCLREIHRRRWKLMYSSRNTESVVTCVRRLFPLPKQSWPISEMAHSLSGEMTVARCHMCWKSVLNF